MFGLVLDAVVGAGLRRDRRAFGLAEHDGEGGAELFLEPLHQRSRHRGAAGADRLDRREIGGRKRRVLQHGDQHGGNADHRVAAIGAEHFEHDGRVEGFDQHLGCRLRDRADHAADAAAGVKQRHGGDEDVAGIDAHPVGGVGAVVEKPAMAEQGALRKAGRARRILDHDGVVGTDGGQRDALVVARGDEGIPVVEADDLAQLGAVRRHRLHRLQHRIAAKTVDDEDPGRARLLQHILHLPGAKGRVHGDQHHARHPGAELEHHPFREVLRPDRDALARLERDNSARAVRCASR